MDRKDEHENENNGMRKKRMISRFPLHYQRLLPITTLLFKLRTTAATSLSLLFVDYYHHYMNNTIQGGEGGQITAINCSESKMKNGIHTTTSIENKEDTERVTELSPSDLAKKAAAYACGEAEIKSGMSLGVGSGTTMKFFIDWLNEKSKDGHIKDIRCVPTSFQTRLWLQEASLPVYDIDQLNNLDLTIDGADEVDAQLNCIKGGGGCLLQEKLVQTCAKRFAVIGGLDKYSKSFGKASKSIPIEIAPLGHAAVQRWIIDKHGGKCVLRMNERKCFPVITENHNYLLDWHFPKPVERGTNWNAINQSLLCTPGVAETGLFIGVANVAYFSTPEGEIHRVLPEK